MSQSKLESFIETSINIIIGYVISIIAQLIILPMMDIHITMSENLQMGLWFTIISFIRSYLIRRYFNARLHATAARLAHAVDHDNK